MHRRESYTSPSSKSQRISLESNNSSYLPKITMYQNDKSAE